MTWGLACYGLRQGYALSAILAESVSNVLLRS